jgi:hypothetical protein
VIVSGAFAWVLACSLATGGCVPEGPATGKDSKSKGKRARPAAKSPGTQRARSAPSDPALSGVFRDDFERAEPGPEWRTASKAWRIEDGELCAQAARNHGIWLKRTLPTNARIEFDARSSSKSGDLKAEMWGDGVSGATSVSYDDATSYLIIFGGWHNRFHVLARLDEHGEDRLERRTDGTSPDPKAKPVKPGQRYHFKIERGDGRTVSWWVDDELMFELEDPEPLTGPGHDHLGFNNWMVPVCFDNLQVTPL